MGLKNISKITTNQICWGLSFLFLFLYLFIVFRNTVNVPEYDDFDALLKFLSDFTQSASLSEKLNLLFAQHNEHRLLFTRLVVIANYWLAGGINISALIVVSNLFLLGIGVTLCLFVKQHKNVALYALLIVLLLFNGQNFENSIWAMVGLANIGTLLLAILSAYLVLDGRKSHFAVGLLLSIITIFSNGNGILLFPTLAVALFLSKRKKELAWFIILAGVAIVGYFLGYHKTSAVSYSDLIRHIHIPIINFFNFIGCNLWIPTFKFAPFLYGLFIVSTYLLSLYLKTYKKNITWFAFFTFMLLTAAAVAANRANVEGMGPLRYRIYGSMFSVLTFMFYFENRDLLRIKTLFNIAVPFIAAFSILCTSLYYAKAENMTEFKKVSTYSWQHSKSGLVTYAPVAEAILAKAEELNIYQMPQIPLSIMVSGIEKSGTQWKDGESNIRYSIDFIEEKEGYLLIRGWAYLETGVMNFTDISLWLFNSRHEFRIRPYHERRADITSDPNKRDCGFFAIIPQKAIPQEEYKLGIEIQKKYIFPVNKMTRSTNVLVNFGNKIAQNI